MEIDEKLGIQEKGLANLGSIYRGGIPGKASKTNGKWPEMTKPNRTNSRTRDQFTGGIPGKLIKPMEMARYGQIKRRNLPTSGSIYRGDS